jgi:hypothetical protein
MRFAAIDVKIPQPLLYHVPLTPLEGKQGERGGVEEQARSFNTTTAAAKWQ